jgi:hypothetical protein
LSKVGKRGDADQLSVLVTAKAKVVSERSKATLNKKLRNLKEQQSGKSESTDQKKTVINLSNRVLSDSEKSVGECGLNFSIAPSNGGFTECRVAVASLSRRGRVAVASQSRRCRVARFLEFWYMEYI